MDAFTNNQQGGQGLTGGGGGLNLGSGAGAGANANAANAGATKEDPVDKAFDFVSQKAGKPVNRSTGEKITDAGRKVFEKVTGKPVNPKISN